MNIKKPLFAALLLLSGLAFKRRRGRPGAAPAAPATAPAAAAPAAAPEPPGQGTQYTEKGADTCLTCHVEGGDFPVYAIFKSKHGNRADKRTPFAPGHLQCEACHGPGAKHAGSGDKNAINSFEADSFLTPQQRNKFCLACHQGNARIGWQGSTHESNNLACTDCHKIHAEHDPVLATATQPDVCYKCHKQQRMDFSKPSAHPVRFGKMACSDCHSPHGSNNDALLAKPTVNQTLLHLPCGKARAVPVGACAGGGGLHPVPLAARDGAPDAVEKDSALAVPAVPCGGRPSLGGAHRGRACRAAAPADRLSCSPEAASIAIRRFTARTIRRASS